MAALANEIGDHPVLLPLLDVFDFQSRQFCAAQATAQENGECGVVPLSAKAANIYGPQKALALLSRKPIANRHTQPFGPLHKANLSC
jgi:hypothetical protein